MSAKTIRFAQIVLSRRNELGLTQDDVTARGGPSDTTLSAIEAGQWSVGSPSTFKKLDRALGWTDGSARLTFNGGDPEEATTSEMPPGSGFHYPTSRSRSDGHSDLRAVWDYMSELNDRLARVEQQLPKEGEDRDDTASIGDDESASVGNVRELPSTEPVRKAARKGRKQATDEPGDGS